MDMYKLIVRDREISTRVQEHAFKLGYHWPEEFGPTKVQETDKLFLFLDADGEIAYGDTDYIEGFCNKEVYHEPISVEDFLDIEPEIEEPDTHVTDEEIFDKFWRSGDGWYRVVGYDPELREYLLADGSDVDRLWFSGARSTDYPTGK